MKSRAGTVLVVMIGITAILGSLTLALALRVKSSMGDRGLIQRHAQAFMMMQASAIYLNRRWDPSLKAPEHPSGNNRAGFSAVGGLRGGLCTSLSADYPLASKLGWYKIVMPNPATTEYLITAVGGGSRAESIPTKTPTEIRYFLKYNADPASCTFSQILWPRPTVTISGTTTVTNWPTIDPEMWP